MPIPRAGSNWRCVSFFFATFELWLLNFVQIMNGLGEMTNFWRRVGLARVTVSEVRVERDELRKEYCALQQSIKGCLLACKDHGRKSQSCTWRFFFFVIFCVMAKVDFSILFWIVIHWNSRRRSCNTCHSDYYPKPIKFMIIREDRKFLNLAYADCRRWMRNLFLWYPEQDIFERF